MVDWTGIAAFIALIMALLGVLGAAMGSLAAERGGP